jgi:hypothetical protein
MQPAARLFEVPKWQGRARGAEPMTEGARENHSDKMRDKMRDKIRDEMRSRRRRPDAYDMRRRCDDDATTR